MENKRAQSVDKTNKKISDNSSDIESDKELNTILKELIKIKKQKIKNLIRKKIYFQKRSVQKDSSILYKYEE